MRNVSLVCWMHLHAKSLWNASRNRNANAIYTSRLGVFNLLTWFAFASTQYQNCVSLCTVQSLLFCRSASSRNWTLAAFVVACRIWGKLIPFLRLLSVVVAFSRECTPTHFARFKLHLNINIFRIITHNWCAHSDRRSLGIDVRNDFECCSLIWCDEKAVCHNIVQDTIFRVEIVRRDEIFSSLK